MFCSEISKTKFLDDERYKDEEGNLELIQLMVSQNVPSKFSLFKNECGLIKITR